MISKLVKFILPIVALTPLIMTSLPASAQTSGMGMQNQSKRGSTMNQNRGGVSTPSQSTTPSSQSPSNSINNNRNLSSYSPQNAPLLRVGSRGQAVKDIQAFLERQKLYNGPTDGVYGSKTRSAVAGFQRSHKLTADGVVGQKTWSSMINSPVS